MFQLLTPGLVPPPPVRVPTGLTGGLGRSPACRQGARLATAATPGWRSCRVGSLSPMSAVLMGSPCSLDLAARPLTSQGRWPNPPGQRL